MSAGSSRTGSADDGSDHVGQPDTNEWDQILAKAGSDEWIKNWGSWSWCQDTRKSNSSQLAIRGKKSANDWDSYNIDALYDVGFGPALEVMNPGTLGHDGLKEVTLKLNGGSLNGNGEIKIICAGDSFTAPSSEGLTAPYGKAFSLWIGSNGRIYSAGAEVPNNVTSLTAQWVDSVAKIITGTGDKFYATLQKAVDAVEDGQTIQLLKDIYITTEPISIQSGNKNFTLDLHGKKITKEYADVAISHSGSGTLTIADNSSEKSGTITATTALIALYGGGSLRVISRTLRSNSQAYAVIYNTGSGSRVYIEGGAVTNTGVGIFNGSTDNKSPSLIISGGLVKGGTAGISNYGSVDITGGEVTSALSAISNNGSLSISGGLVTNTASDQPAIRTVGDGNISISGTATVTSANGKTDSGTIYLLYYMGDSSKTPLVITGGTIENTNTSGTAVYSYYGNIAISGGSAVIKGGGKAM